MEIESRWHHKEQYDNGSLDVALGLSEAEFGAVNGSQRSSQL
jgi:hypothetical protein